jgi:hypothetical protein
MRCGDKNKIRRVRYLKGRGIAIFVGTAPILESKYEKQSKEHELVQKSRPGYNQNEERTMKLTKTNKYERRLKLKGVKIIKIFSQKNRFLITETVLEISYCGRILMSDDDLVRT